MQSASTFAHPVVEVRREVSERKGIGVQLFFTGHSSGGFWCKPPLSPLSISSEKGIYFLKIMIYKIVIIHTQQFLTAQAVKERCHK
jgi:hypothetical protein